MKNWRTGFAKYLQIRKRLRKRQCLEGCASWSMEKCVSASAVMKSCAALIRKFTKKPSNAMDAVPWFAMANQSRAISMLMKTTSRRRRILITGLISAWSIIKRQSLPRNESRSKLYLYTYHYINMMPAANLPVSPFRAEKKLLLFNTVHKLETSICVSGTPNC
jgi:hypothetical protein